MHTAKKNTETSVLASKVMQDEIAIKLSIIAPLNVATFEIFGNNLKESKFHSGRN